MSKIGLENAIKCILYNAINLKAFTRLPRYEKPVPTPEFNFGFGGCEILWKDIRAFHESLEGRANDSEFMIPLAGFDR